MSSERTERIRKAASMMKPGASVMDLVRALLVLFPDQSMLDVVNSAKSDTAALSAEQKEVVETYIRRLLVRHQLSVPSILPELARGILLVAFLGGGQADSSSATTKPTFHREEEMKSTLEPVAAAAPNWKAVVGWLVVMGIILGYDFASLGEAVFKGLSVVVQLFSAEAYGHVTGQETKASPVGQLFSDVASSLHESRVARWGLQAPDDLSWETGRQHLGLRSQRHLFTTRIVNYVGDADMENRLRRADQYAIMRGIPREPGIMTLTMRDVLARLYHIYRLMPVFAELFSSLDNYGEELIAQNTSPRFQSRWAQFKAYVAKAGGLVATFSARIGSVYLFFMMFQLGPFDIWDMIKLLAPLSDAWLSDKNPTAFLAAHTAPVIVSTLASLTLLPWLLNGARPSSSRFKRHGRVVAQIMILIGAIAWGDAESVTAPSLVQSRLMDIMPLGATSWVSSFMSAWMRYGEEGTYTKRAAGRQSQEFTYRHQDMYLVGEILGGITLHALLLLFNVRTKLDIAFFAEEEPLRFDPGDAKRPVLPQVRAPDPGDAKRPVQTDVKSAPGDSKRPDARRPETAKQLGEFVHEHFTKKPKLHPGQVLLVETEVLKIAQSPEFVRSPYAYIALRRPATSRLHEHVLDVLEAWLKRKN